ncbi:MAG: hypothetical protein KDB01_21795 [Planctomycetaceae bacterium]|nr:hypothetical protein [Planctomycetaceae bacterium]
MFFPSPFRNVRHFNAIGPRQVSGPRLTITFVTHAEDADFADSLSFARVGSSSVVIVLDEKQWTPPGHSAFILCRKY